MNSRIQVISFDLDGTLVDDAFDQSIWFQDIPRRYAARYGLGFEAAKSRVLADYRELRGHPRWTDMAFWFRRFDIGEWRPAAEALAHLIRPYPETRSVLDALEPRARLIIVTQAEPKFYRIKLRVAGLGDYFEAVYSTPERFGKLAKDAQVFREVLRDLDIAPNELLHVGDDPLYDRQVPLEEGIPSLLLDRRNRHRGAADVIRDLRGVLAYLDGA